MYDMQPHDNQQGDADSRGPPSVFVFHLPGTIAVPKVLPSMSFPDTTNNSGSIAKPFVVSSHGATVFIAELRVNQSDQQGHHCAGEAASTNVTTAVLAHEAPMYPQDGWSPSPVDLPVPRRGEHVSISFEADEGDLQRTPFPVHNGLVTIHRPLLHAGHTEASSSCLQPSKACCFLAGWSYNENSKTISSSACNGKAGRSRAAKTLI